MPSSPQTVATVVVFDYLIGTNGKPITNATVNCTLNVNFAMAISPVVSLGQLQQSTTTDQNGYYQFTLVPNININPANTTYDITTPDNVWSISIPTGAGPFQVTQSGVLVNTPPVLAPPLQSFTGPITITGNLAVTGNETVGGTLGVTGGTTLAAVTANSENVTGDLTVGGRIIEQAAVSKLVPGPTSFAIRDTADLNNNLLITNAGAATIRSGLTITAGGETITAGGLIVSAGGATVSAGGISSTGSPDLTLGTATSRIVPGATSISLRNNNNNADNLIITDVGNATLRGTLNSGAITSTGLVTTQTTSFHAEAYQNGTQGAIANGTSSGVQFNTVLADPNSNYTQPGNVGTYTCPIAGRYMVATQIAFSAAVLGRIIVTVNHSGADSKRVWDANPQVQCGGTAIVRAALNDTLAVSCTNGSGASVTLVGTPQYTQWVAFEYIGPL